MNAVLAISAVLVPGEQEPPGSSVELGQMGPGTLVSSEHCFIPDIPCMLHTIPVRHIKAHEQFLNRAISVRSTLLY